MAVHESPLDDPVTLFAYSQAVCTGRKRWQEMGTSIPSTAKQEEYHKNYTQMEFKSEPINDPGNYPDGWTIKPDKYPHTQYILKFLPQEHQLVVYHMARQLKSNTLLADPLSASVVLYEQWVTHAGPQPLRSLKHINVASDQGSKVMMVIGAQDQRFVTPSQQELISPEGPLNDFCTQFNDVLKGENLKKELESARPTTDRDRNKITGKALKDAGVLDLLRKVDLKIANFLALLGIENATSAIWLINDYGDKLQIKTITSIESGGHGQNVIYHFVE